MMNFVQQHEIPQHVAHDDWPPGEEGDGAIEVLGSQFLHARERIVVDALKIRAQIFDRSRSLDPCRFQVS